MVTVEFEATYNHDDGVQDVFWLKEDGKALIALTRQEALDLMNDLEKLLTDPLLY